MLYVTDMRKNSETFQNRDFNTDNSRDLKMMTLVVVSSFRTSVASSVLLKTWIITHIAVVVVRLQHMNN
jgi:hypothetical protein